MILGVTFGVTDILIPSYNIKYQYIIVQTR